VELQASLKLGATQTAIPMVTHSTTTTSSATPMEMKKMSNSNTFVARIRLSGGIVQKVTIEADDANKDRMMLEAQYGKGNVIFVGRA